jgi:hypothetical protein
MAGYTQVWVSQYKSSFGDLPNVEQSTLGFSQKLVASGLAIKSVFRSNMEAKDWLLQPGSRNICEERELLHFVGHSTTEGPQFRQRTSNNGVANYRELQWGTGNLRWVVIDGCLTLNPIATSSKFTNIFSRWGTVFSGLRGLYGFSSLSTSETTRGTAFATYLVEGEPIWLAWMKACQESESETAEFAVLTVAVEGALDLVEDGNVAEGAVGDADALLTPSVAMLPNDRWPQDADLPPVDAQATGLVYFTAHV